MKWSSLAVFLILLFIRDTQAQENLILKDQKAKLSYSYGVEAADKIKKMPVPLDLDLVIMGLKDAMTGDKLLLTDKEVREALITLQKEITAKSEDQKKALAEKNKREGEAFLAENKKKEGVITLPSGLQYKVLKEGTGKSPKETDWVTIHFRGSLIDGTVFEDTRKSFNQPVAFAVKGMVPGWAEGMKLMKEGGKYMLFIPPELAMGERGSGTLIGPNATLIIEVELISVQEKR
ncbi:MAG: FKBP-type peptidyl-prolyl cis-trans isomerase [Treponemataceae bacterium]|nr:FKBP-type peptidyl-prolyl cis-trans isomerase [Treponemataceae bacterium]